MKHLFNIIPLYFAIVLFSCNPKQKPEIPASPSWQAIVIVSERSTEFIISDKDSSTVLIHPAWSFFSPPPPKGYKPHTDTVKIHFTKTEKDSIAYLVKNLIVNPVKVDKFCTEYVGKLELNIYYGQFKINGVYSSVCDWTNLSNETTELYRILKRRYKKWDASNIPF